MTNKALLEIEAIDSVRNELTLAVKLKSNPVVVTEIHSRLISLYASLDVKNIRSIIQVINYKVAA